MSNSKLKRIQTVISQENHDVLQEIARSQGLSIADFIREAIKQRCRELGHEIDITVSSWGGKRRGSGRKKPLDMPRDTAT
jgi:Ribbon-helix-helix protein, copG family